MSKKYLLSVLSSIFVLFVSFAYFFYEDYADYSGRIALVGDTEYGVEFQVTGNKPLTDDIRRSIEEIANRYEVSILRCSESLREDGLVSTVYSGAFSWQSFPVGQLGLLSGTLPAGQDEFLASYVTGDVSQVGVVYDFAGGNPLVIQSLQRGLEDSGSLDGIYRIVSTVPYDESAAIDELSHVFELSPEELLSRNTYVAHGMGGALYLFGAMALLGLLLYMLTLVSVPVANAKTVAVQKLNGWTNGSIYKDMVRWSVVVQLGSIAVFDVALLTAVHPIRLGFFGSLLFVQGLAFAVVQLCGVFALLIVRRLSVVDMLKGGISLKVPLLLGTTVKFALLACVVLFLFLASSSLDLIWHKLDSYSAWRDQGETYYVLSRTATTEEQIESLSSGTSGYEDKFGSLYELLNDEYRGCYVSTMGRVIDEQESPRKLMNINVNYLNTLDLKTADGHDVTVEEGELSRVVLLPSKMSESEKSAVLEEIRFLNKTMAEAEASRWESDAWTWDRHLKVLTYEGGREFFTFDGAPGAGDTEMARDPVFCVLTKGNIAHMEKNDLVLTGASAPMKLPIDASEATELKTWLDANGFAQDDVQFGLLSEVYSEELGEMMSSLLAALMAVGTLLVISILASYLIARLLVLAYGRTYTVERLLGWSWLLRHRFELGIVGGVMSLLVMCMLLSGFSGIALAVGAMVLAGDAAVLFLLIGMYERHDVVALVKGA